MVETRIAKDVLLKLKNQKGKEQKQGKSSETLRNYEHAALVILVSLGRSKHLIGRYYSVLFS